jgi:hypothetical protein
MPVVRRTRMAWYGYCPERGYRRGAVGDSAGAAVGRDTTNAVAISMCALCLRIVLVIDCCRVVYDSKLTRRKLMCASNCCLRTAMVLSCWGRFVSRTVRRWLCCSTTTNNLSNCARMRCALIRWAAGVSNRRFGRSLVDASKRANAAVVLLGRGGKVV